MALRPEQARRARHCSQRCRRDAKRALRRLRRRAEKRDVENAPGQVRELLRGWAD